MRMAFGTNLILGSFAAIALYASLGPGWAQQHVAKGGPNGGSHLRGGVPEQRKPAVGPATSATEGPPSATSPAIAPENTVAERTKLTESISIFGFRFRVTDGLLVVFTGILAIFTGLLWDSTKKLWQEAKFSSISARKAADAAEKSVTIAQATLIYAHRAYVHMDLDLVAMFSEGDPGKLVELRMQPIWANAGQTPAANVALWVTCGVRDDPLLFDADLSFTFTKGPNQVLADIGPGLKVRGSMLQVTPEEFNGVKEGTRHIYVWGGADYRDVFPDTPIRKTRFCLELKPSVRNLRVPFEFSKFGSLNYSA